MTTAPQQRPVLLLWGFMATGKSTVAALVAERTNARFVDLDALIEAQQATTIEALFGDRGEAAFRQIEQDTLRRRLAAGTAADVALVIALGGGTLLDDDLRRAALEQAYVVTLTAQPDAIAIRAEGSARPLLGAADRPAAIERLLAQRSAAYGDAHRCIATDRRTPSEVAEIVVGVWLAGRTGDPATHK